MDQSHRPVVITGNWKMHKNLEEANSFIEAIKPVVEKSPSQIWLAVPFTLLYPLTRDHPGSALKIGAQNMNDASQGAFTGEIAGKMLLDAGAYFVLLGHSERRRIFHEDCAFINRKVKKALEVGLRPVLCIGETIEEYEAKQTHAVIRKQIKQCLLDLTPEELAPLVIAYEPVWAIGSDHSATPEIAQEVHHFCRTVLGEEFSPELAEKVVIQYGGSVNPSNAKELLNEPDIDGLLIGGASLSLETFSQIVEDK
ncbi:MAG: triose-phosphate isomerase [Candidatus Protochlamydia sp.]|nr:triose-phosphate isomerase [Candidatus Protochlamydia sp.]